jgi:hypothetical protein
MSYDPQKVTFRETAVCAISAERKTGQTKNELFWHVRRCIKDKGSNVEEGLKLFLSKCAEEERWMTSKEAGPMYTPTVPDLWMQGKSDIKRAIENGISPMDHPSYSSLREAKNTKSKGVGKLNNATKPQRDATVTTTVEQALESGEVVDAKNTTMCPEDLLPVVALLKPLTELARARAIKQLTQVAKVASEHFMESAREAQRRANK